MGTQILGNTSILFRYYKAETPYLKAFLQHYASLGASHYIAIVQTDEDKKSIEAHFETLSENSIIKIIQLPEELNCDRALIELDLQKIKHLTEFVLNVDCDELLFVQNQKSFNNKDKVNMREFMKGKSRYHLKWVMTTFSGTTPPSQFGYQMGYGKDIARSDLITGMENVHKFTTEETSSKDSPHAYDLQIGLAHHWGRTFNDTLLKICYQRERLPGNPKNNDFNTIESFLTEQELPKRFRYMAFIEAREKTIDVSTTNNQKLYDLNCEESLLMPYATPKQTKELKILYREYLERITMRGQAFIQMHTDTGVNKAIQNIISLQDLRQNQ